MKRYHRCADGCYPTLTERQMMAWSELLTGEGPVLDIGSLVISPDVWRTVPAMVIAPAIWLHECGFWGAIPRSLWALNDNALLTGGLVVSQWFPEQHWPFGIVTNTLVNVTQVLNLLDA